MARGKRIEKGLLVGLTLLGGLAMATPVEDSMAIVVSQAVMDDPEWREATVETLKARYAEPKVYVWKESLGEVLPALSEQMPSYTAFVVKPEQAGTQFTIAISNLCRRLDADPYVDTFWGVVTGYDASTAHLVASADNLSIERVLDTSGMDITAFPQVWKYSEDHRGITKYWHKGETPAVVETPCEEDNTEGILKALQQDKIQFITTSGHATQHDWQMGYGRPNMAMIHRDGKLYVVNTQKKVQRAKNPEPKLYFATGNCLIGDIDQTDCMALSWMKDGGVRQMMGYTVTTWFGAQGWGTQGIFGDTSGLTTATEAFHFANTAIIQRLLEWPIPDLISWKLSEIKEVNYPQTPGMIAWAEAQDKAGRPLDEIRSEIQNIAGNLHDRDVVCFYGDPGMEARVADGRFKKLPASLEGDTLTLSAEVREGARDGTLWFRLPGSWTYDPAELKASPALGTPDLALDNILRFPNAKASTAIGETLTITIPHAKRIGQSPALRTSKDSAQ